MFPFLKLQSSDCTVYLKISRLRKDEEWIDFSIELRSEELLVVNGNLKMYNYDSLTKKPEKRSFGHTQKKA